MTNKVFTDYNTVIDAPWLNDVNGATYHGTGVNVPAGSITSTTQQAAINELDTLKAPLASPSLTGTPTAPTAVSGTNSTQVATTAYADAATAATTHSATSKATPVDADEFPLADSAATYGLKKTLWSDIKTTLANTFTSLSQKDATGGYAGLTLFKINFKNAANTFTSYFTNTNTASRTYTTQDRDGTLADLTDIAGLFPYSSLVGCTMSTAGSSATLSIAAGKCTDSTNTTLISLSAIAKTTSAWALGTAAGGLDTGAIANSTWYHFYVIRRTDTGVVDVVFSTNATSPTMPASYTQYRRIGSAKTNGSAQWTKFIQDGDLFTWDVPVNDVNVTNPGITAVTRTLTTPLGVRTEARIAVHSSVGGSGTNLLITDLSLTDTAPSATIFSTYHPFANSAIDLEVNKYTNTSSQIRTRHAVSDANVGMQLITLGWKDNRGRDA